MNDAKILIVEDEVLIARSLEMLLRRFGYRAISWVAKGEDAIKQVNTSPPDLILMDIKLRNEIDGIETVERILKERFIPVIYLTAYSDEETVARAKRTEPYAYLTKPVNEVDLRLNIEIALYKASVDKRVRRREELYRAVIKTVGEGIVVQEASGKIIEWNDTAEKLFGIPAHEAIGRTSLDYPWPTIREDGSPYPAYEHPSMHTLRTGEPCRNVVMGIQRSDGECRWISINTEPLFTEPGEKPSAVVISFRDITNYKRIQDALRESNERYALALSGARLGTWELHLPSGTAVFNEQLAEMLGYSLEEIKQSVPPWESLVHPDDFHHVMHAVQDHCEGKTAFYEAEYRMRHKLGKWIWVFSRGKVMSRDAHGNAVRICGTCLDITERKHTELVFKARLRLLERAETSSVEELLRATLDACEEITESHVGFFHFIEPDQQTISLQAWSTNTLRLCSAAGKGFHYPVQNAGVWVDCIYEKKPVIHNDYAALPHRKGMPEGHVSIVRELVVPIVRKDNVVAVLGVGNKETLYDDRDVQAVSTIADLVWDIIEHKKIEEALLLAERQYRSIFEGTRNAIAVYRALHDGEDFVFVDFNAAAERIEHISRDKVIGRSVTEVFPSVRAFGLFEVFQRVWRTGNPEHFPVKYYKDNRIAGWRDNYVYKLPSGEIVAIYSDETPRKQAEENLQRIMTAIEQAHEAIVITNTEGAIEYVNPAFERMTGYSPQEAIGQNPRILKSGAHDQVFYEQLWQTITSGQTWQGNFINRKKDGALYNEAAVISPVKDKDGTIINFVAVKRDVTEEQRLEEQLRQSQKMEALGTLAGGIAHDFNNIIAGIMNYAEIGLDDLSNAASVRESFTWILKLCDRAADMIKQILTFSRQSPQERQVVHLGSFVKESLKLLRATIPTNIALHSAVAPDTGSVYANITQLHEILINLCANAAYAMREQGGTITVSVGNEYIVHQHPDFPTLQPGDYVRLSVCDTGPGIPKELQEKIFDPFFTTKAPGEGTGIGLAVVHRIVTEHQGAIAVRSEPGMGATFTVMLPQSQEEKTSAVPSSHGSLLSAARGREHILLVDDEQAIRETISLTLKKLGYTVTTCENGLEAWRLFQQRPDDFHLVLTDQTMPGMTGHVLAQQITHLRPRMPVLLMTGYSQLIDPATIHSFGVKKLLMKPVHHDILIQEIRKALENEM